MKNCVICHHPVSDDCYVLIKGRRSGDEFQLGDDAEFVCNECVKRVEEEGPEPRIEVGNIVLVKA